jgi:hypothetical protein
MVGWPSKIYFDPSGPLSGSKICEGFWETKRRQQTKMKKMHFRKVSNKWNLITWYEIWKKRQRVPGTIVVIRWDEGERAKRFWTAPLSGGGAPESPRGAKGARDWLGYTWIVSDFSDTLLMTMCNDNCLHFFADYWYIIKILFKANSFSLLRQFHDQ